MILQRIFHNKLDFGIKTENVSTTAAQKVLNKRNPNFNQKLNEQFDKMNENRKFNEKTMDTKCPYDINTQKRLIDLKKILSAEYGDDVWNNPGKIFANREREEEDDDSEVSDWEQSDEEGETEAIVDVPAKKSVITEKIKIVENAETIDRNMTDSQKDERIEENNALKSLDEEYNSSVKPNMQDIGLCKPTIDLVKMEDRPKSGKPKDNIDISALNPLEIANRMVCEFDAIEIIDAIDIENMDAEVAKITETLNKIHNKSTQGKLNEEDENKAVEEFKDYVNKHSDLGGNYGKSVADFKNQTKVTNSSSNSSSPQNRGTSGPVSGTSGTASPNKQESVTSSASVNTIGSDYEIKSYNPATSDVFHQVMTGIERPMPNLYDFVKQHGGAKSLSSMFKDFKIEDEVRDGCKQPKALETSRKGLKSEEDGSFEQENEKVGQHLKTDQNDGQNIENEQKSSKKKNNNSSRNATVSSTPSASSFIQDTILRSIQNGQPSTEHFGNISQETLKQIASHIIMTKTRNLQQEMNNFEEKTNTLNFPQRDKEECNDMIESVKEKLTSVLEGDNWNNLTAVLRANSRDDDEYDECDEENNKFGQNKFYNDEVDLLSLGAEEFPISFSDEEYIEDDENRENNSKTTKQHIGDGNLATGYLASENLRAAVDPKLLDKIFQKFKSGDSDIDFSKLIENQLRVNSSSGVDHHQMISQAMNRTINKTINQTLNQTVNQTLNQTINQTLDETVRQTVVNQTMNENLSKNLTQNLTQNFASLPENLNQLNSSQHSHLTQTVPDHIFKQNQQLVLDQNQCTHHEHSFETHENCEHYHLHAHENSIGRDLSNDTHKATEEYFKSISRDLDKEILSEYEEEKLNPPKKPKIDRRMVDGRCQDGNGPRKRPFDNKIVDDAEDEYFDEECYNGGNAAEVKFNSAKDMESIGTIHGEQPVENNGTSVEASTQNNSNPQIGQTSIQPAVHSHIEQNSRHIEHTCTHQHGETCDHTDDERNGDGIGLDHVAAAANAVWQQNNHSSHQMRQRLKEKMANRSRNNDNSENRNTVAESEDQGTKGKKTAQTQENIEDLQLRVEN